MIKAKVIDQKSETLEDEEHEKTYGPLYDGLKTSHWMYKCFLIIDTSRKIIYVLLLVVLTNYPEAQLYSIIAMQTVFLLANVIVRPYKSKNLNIVVCTMEFGLLLTLSTFAVLMNDDLSDYHSAVTWTSLGLLGVNIGLVAIIILIASLIGLVIAAVNGIAYLIKKCKTPKTEPERDIDATATYQLQELMTTKIRRNNWVRKDTTTDLSILAENPDHLASVFK